jgi:hypothetical protein
VDSAAWKGAMNVVDEVTKIVSRETALDLAVLNPYSPRERAELFESIEVLFVRREDM